MKNLHLIELNVLTIYCLCTKMRCFRIKKRMSIELFSVFLLRLQKIESTYNVNWRFYSRLRETSWQQKNLKRESDVFCHSTNWFSVEIVYIDLTIHVEWKIHSRSKKTSDLEKKNVDTSISFCESSHSVRCEIFVEIIFFDLTYNINKKIYFRSKKASRRRKILWSAYWNNMFLL
jgi:hypothetical protein